MTKVFIDGSAGTTGLKIYERLAKRKDIEIISLPEALRKDESARKDAFASSDIAFLCLPDDAAVEAEKLLGSSTVVIDTSTAHRTALGWTYGLAELKGQRELIAKSNRIANPGCHASGFIALVAPLISSGALSDKAQLSCVSLTGYSGGGKKMIAEYESNQTELLKAPRLYALSQTHKHLKEMVKQTGLKNYPVFCPVVEPFYSGMEVMIPLFKSDIKAGINEINDIYKEYYAGQRLIKVNSESENGFLSAALLSGKDNMIISVTGNEDRIALVARFDNLGKGASGAAIQNMNIIIGADECEGLVID